MRNFTRITDFIDSHGQHVLTLMTALMLTFFFSFALVLAEVSRAQAQVSSQQACGGVDLIAKFAKEDPDKLADLQRQAAETANGQGVFWKIEKDGIAPSWLLGTMHMTDERIAKLEGKKATAFETSDTIIVENIEALDPALAQAALLEHQNMTLYTDGTTLVDRLDDETIASLKEATAERGMPFEIVKIMQPWLIATSLALPACELASKQSGQPVLDGLIGEKAKAEGKKLVGLETVGEQFSAMYKLPEDFHIAALKETLKLGTVAEDIIETMKQLYLKGEIGIIQPLTKAVSPNTSQSESYEDFTTSLISDRNQVMAERSLPYLMEGGAFVAVGALHLPGKLGLVEKYREAGFTVTRAD